ncbi:MAG: hypothetical protein JWQ98_1367 [Chlorobi bacterium]|nr:hypothetical protein [Chlorobiota bacterium]
MNITIHIERLILDGIDINHADRPALQAAIETELARLMADGGIEGLRSGGATPVLRAPAIDLVRGSTPARMGEQIAGAVHGGLGKQSR